MMRLEGWESRLNAVLDEARERPYVLGEHDCFRVVCRVIEALTGKDCWPEWRGYKTKRESMALLSSKGHHNFEDAFDWFFGSPRQPVAMARRGDACALQTSDGEKHLGVCAGVRVAVLLPERLAFLHRDDFHCSWRIG